MNNLAQLVAILIFIVVFTIAYYHFQKGRGEL